MLKLCLTFQVISFSTNLAVDYFYGIQVHEWSLITFPWVIQISGYGRLMADGDYWGLMGIYLAAINPIWGLMGIIGD